MSISRCELHYVDLKSLTPGDDISNLFILLMTKILKKGKQIMKIMDLLDKMANYQASFKVKEEKIYEDGTFDFKLVFIGDHQSLLHSAEFIDRNIDYFYVDLDDCHLCYTIIIFKE